MQATTVARKVTGTFLQRCSLNNTKVPKSCYSSANNRRFFRTSSIRRSPTTYFAESHEWIRVDDDGKKATIGVSDFAQKELGKIVFVDLPEPPHEVPAGESVAAIECGDGKAVGEVYVPQACEVQEINTSLEDEPSIINSSPYDEGWIVKVEFGEKFDGEGHNLMDEEKYLKYLETCEKHH